MCQDCTMTRKIELSQRKLSLRKSWMERHGGRQIPNMTHIVIQVVTATGTQRKQWLTLYEESQSTEKWAKSIPSRDYLVQKCKKESELYVQGQGGVFVNGIEIFARLYAKHCAKPLHREDMHCRLFHWSRFFILPFLCILPHEISKFFSLMGRRIHSKFGPVTCFGQRNVRIWQF